MRIAKVEIPLYTIDELKDSSKEKAIREHREFLLCVTDTSDFEENINAYIDWINDIESNDEPVLESIRMNEYLFFTDGEFVDTVTYVDKHPEKAGITELKLFGQVYII
jgi:hypothetical protein